MVTIVKDINGQKVLIISRTTHLMVSLEIRITQTMTSVWYLIPKNTGVQVLDQPEQIIIPVPLLREETTIVQAHINPKDQICLDFENKNINILIFINIK